MSGELALLKPIKDLTTTPTEALKERLTSLLARTADDLMQMAQIVAELESRNEDLSALRLGIVDHLRRIAAGQTLPETVVRFSGFPQMLRIAAHLPIPDQRKLANGESVELAVWREDAVEWRKIDPLCLTRDQVTQVFSGDRIRSQPEQIALIEDRRLRKPRTKPAALAGNVRPDRAKGGIVIGSRFCSAADVLIALAELHEPADPDEPEDTPMVVKLRESEHRRLKVRAAETGCDMGDLVRRALRAGGLI